MRNPRAVVAGLVMAALVFGGGGGLSMWPPVSVWIAALLVFVVTAIATDEATR